MNKKIMLTSIMLLVLLIISAIPAYAKPSQWQKTEVTVVFITPAISTNVTDNWVVGSVRHLSRDQLFNVELREGDASGPILEIGTALVERKGVIVLPKGKETGKMILVDYYVFTFGDGGFEGNGLVMLDDFVAGTWGQTLARGLFQGTGTFEGQTLNIGHPWWTVPGIIWEGYWLKTQ